MSFFAASKSIFTSTASYVAHQQRAGSIHLNECMSFGRKLYSTATSNDDVAPPSGADSVKKSKLAPRRKKLLKRRTIKSSPKKQGQPPSPKDKLLIKPNKIADSWMDEHIKQGLFESDITSAPSQYVFNPNEFYDNVEKAMPQLEEVQKVLKKRQDLFTEDELKNLESSYRTQMNQEQRGKGALVDDAQMKNLIKLSMQRDAEANQEKKRRASGNLVFVTLIRSHNHQQRIVKKSVHQLGLRKIHQTQVHADSPRVRGFIYTCRHLVHLQIVPVRSIFPHGVPPEHVLPEHLRADPRSTMVERSIARAERRRVNKRDYTQVEQKYAHLQKESEKILQSVQTTQV